MPGTAPGPPVSLHADLPPPTLTPSELNRAAKSLLENYFDRVWVEGELSNFARPSSGHWYFTLKDDKAQVRCALFRNRNARLRFTPGNGDRVRLRARVSLYEGRGEFQLVGEFMEAAGAGALQARFDALRQRLQAEGLFATERKQALPRAVSRLAVISSRSGAALQDILRVLERRDPAIEVTVFPSPVQGKHADRALLRALERAEDFAAGRDGAFDALILARGGGSLEDLEAFNSEDLARAIVASPLPVVVGVGHEVDFTIADFAADYRAPTPSAAAEVLSEDRRERLERLAILNQRLSRAVRVSLQRRRRELRHWRQRLRHPGSRLRERIQRTDELELRLKRALGDLLLRHRSRLEHQTRRLRAQSPIARIDRYRGRLGALEHAAKRGLRRRLAALGAALARQKQLVAGLNPLAILRRGYAVIYDDGGRVVRASKRVAARQRLRAVLAEGELALEVLAKDE